MNAIHFSAGLQTKLHPFGIACHSEWLRSTTQGLVGPIPTCPLSKPQCFGFVPIFTRGLASTPWYGTSKVHHEQLRRIGRQSSKLQFIRIRIDAKQLIVVNMLTCSGVPGGGIFGSKHSSNKIVLRKNLDSKPRMIGSIKRHFCTPTEPL